MHSPLFIVTPIVRRPLNFVKRRRLRRACSARMTGSSSTDVNEWLRSARASIANGDKLAVYLGNESCDLDSVVSPLGLAYASHHHSGCAAIPVLNVKRAELRLRRDVEIELENAGVNSALIPCVDDTPVEQVLKLGGGGLTLVDHNELAGHQSQLGEFVTAIVDHHQDTGLYPNATRTMARCGSCATLTTRFITSDDCIPPEVAQLLLAAILSDTHGLERRTIEEDHEAADRLSRIAGIPRLQWHSMLKRISAAKSNLEGFTAREVLLKDYKGFGVAGISSIGRGIEQWMGAEEEALTESVLEQVRVEKGVEAMVVMTAFKDADGAFRREILIHGDTAAGSLLRHNLPNCSGMQLEPKNAHGLKNATCFEQRNLEATRKITAPQIVLVLEELTVL